MTIALTQRDVKNRVIAALPDHEKDALVCEAKETGGYIIVTEYRVIEIYTSVGTVWVQERKFAPQGWDNIDVDDISFD